MTDRVCNKFIEIQDPETGENIKLNPGDKVIIPIVGLQRDSKYYPNPMQFDPERFNEENKLNLVPNTYLPFGVGPRMCIAHRFAFMEIKVLVFYMFSGLSVNLSEKSSVPLELDPSAPQPYPKNGFWVKILEDKQS
uniref:Cytochrome P450 n=1 Tax=Megaselia scalaris TaxID=36166 RepID=T1GX85_MEGSC